MTKKSKIVIVVACLTVLLFFFITYLLGPQFLDGYNESQPTWKIMELSTSAAKTGGLYHLISFAN
ncbi:hypothetical protein [Listeria costaricensis]|uniref:hypothetical protein n=1 Tax=Listeria costaricensis TaxID=2026604 RepID=UPI000C075DB0|nr:hypothetical protein [Listeria costaricensis]